jgi:hypothetical protein
VIRFRKWRAKGGLGSDQPGTSKAYSVEVESPLGSVNTRQVKLWRSDNRYPGQIDVYRDTESGGVVLRFDALRHGGKEPRAVEIVDPRAVDTLILSLLEVRSGEWMEPVRPTTKRPEGR